MRMSPANFRYDRRRFQFGASLMQLLFEAHLLAGLMVGSTPAGREASAAAAAAAVQQDVACVRTCLCSHSRYEGVTVKCIGVANDTGRDLLYGHFSDLENILMKLPSNTRNLYLLQKKLEGLPKDSLKGLQRLRDLYLSYNRLTDYESWSRAMDYHTASTLSHLSLSNNQLQIIWSRAFRYFNMLHSLDLSANDISIIHREAFIGLESLLLLDLRNNSLAALTTNSFLNLQTLQQLFLEYNKIESIDIGSFDSLKHLQTLSLVGNRLKVVISGMFRGLVRLQQLHLSYNIIDKITSKAIEDVSNLMELWLDGNQLTTLDSNLKTAFQRMNYGPVNLGHNPFVCDCNLLWLASWIRQQHIVTVGSDVTAPYPECLAPNQHYGKFVHNVPFRDFQCTNASYHPQPCSWISSNAENQVPKANLSTRTTLLNNCSHLTSSFCSRDSQLKNVSTCLCDVDVPTCYVCPSGSHGRHTTKKSELDCTPCPPLMGSPMGTQNEELCQCLPGFYLNASANLSCTACPVGHYKSELGPQHCKTCPTGSVTLRSGATSCECVPGFQLNHNSDHCEPCPSGTYKAHAGPHRCRTCPDYSKSPPKSVSIDQCRCLYAQARMGMLSSPHRVCLGPKESLNQIYMEAPQQEKTVRPHTNNKDTYIIIIVLLSVALLALISIAIMAIVQKIVQIRLRKQEKIAEAKKARIVQICIPQPVEDAWIRTNLSTWEISRDCLALGHLLGQGAFGQVFQADLQRENKVTKVAVKCCRDGMVSEEQDALWSELKLLIYVGKHQNIVNLIGTAFQQGSLMLVLEYAAHGDLLAFLRSKTNIPTVQQHQQQQLQQQQQQVEMSPSPEAEIPAMTYESPLMKMATIGHRVTDSMIPNVLYNPNPTERRSQFINRRSVSSPSRNNNVCGRPRRSHPTTTVQQQTTTSTSSKATTSTHLTSNSDDHSGLLLSIAWQISKGMRHLEQLKCIHRDLAARNILLADGMVAKISDFGLAREAYESGYYFRQSRGRLPFKWMALETLLQGQFTNKSDVWSFGIILWEEMTLGANPYPGVPLNSLMDLLVSGYRMPKPENCRDDVYEVMRSCWMESPSDRPTFENLSERMDEILQKTANQYYLVVENSEPTSTERPTSSRASSSSSSSPPTDEASSSTP